jgi:hypothetical protein
MTQKQFCMREIFETVEQKAAELREDDAAVKPLSWHARRLVPSSIASLAMLAAIRRASSRVSNLAAACRPGSFSQ